LCSIAEDNLEEGIERLKGLSAAALGYRLSMVKGVPRTTWSSSKNLLKAFHQPKTICLCALCQGWRWYFRSYATLDARPGSLVTGVKFVCVARNPKDTVVSLYHHAHNKPEFGFQGTFEEMLQLFIAGKAENGCWFDHVLPWYEQSLLRPDQVLFLKYEGMYEDTAQAVSH
jgi:hypothetical protein